MVIEHGNDSGTGGTASAIGIVILLFGASSVWGAAVRAQQSLGNAGAYTVCTPSALLLGRQERI
jgi:hypothetical protein